MEPPGPGWHRIDLEPVSICAVAVPEARHADLALG